MRKDTFLIALIFLCMLGLAALGVLHWKQSRQIAAVSDSIVSVNAQLLQAGSQTAATVAGGVDVSADSAPKTLDELRLRLSTKDWTELYAAASPKGAFAMGVLKDFRHKNNLLVREDAKDLYFKGMLSSDQDNPAIVLSGCGEVLAAPFFGPDSEFTPGFQSIAMYSRDRDLAKSGYVYFSPGMEEDELKNRWPILFGPYAAAPETASGSFGELDCIRMSDL